MTTKEPRNPLKSLVLGTLLTGLALFSPLVAHAGIQVVYPESAHTVDINTTPPIQFDKGGDFARAQSLGFLGGWSGKNNNASFDLTLSGLSGGILQIDHYINATAVADINTFKFEVSSALDTGGTLDPDAPDNEIESFYLCAWYGTVAPTNPPVAGSECTDPGANTVVCASLNLESVAGTESTGGPCPDTPDLQLQIYLDLKDDSTGTNSVSIRPSSITFDA